MPESIRDTSSREARELPFLCRSAPVASRDLAITKAAYVLRCSGAATLAYLLAVHAGLPFPEWAAMSSVIVSQDVLRQTSAKLATWILGTTVGIAVALSVDAWLTEPAVSQPVRVALAVGLCALITQLQRGLRVSMWTAPLVLLTARPGAPISLIALNRASELMLGALLGSACHYMSDTLEHRLRQLHAPFVASLKRPRANVCRR